MLYRHVFGTISSEFHSTWHVFVNFIGFCRFTWNLQLHDHAKYQKPWINAMYLVNTKWFYLFRQHPHYARRIWKHSYISNIHINCCENRAFQKTLFKQKEFEKATFLFSCEQNRTYFRSFLKAMVSWQYVTSLTEVSSNKSKMTTECCIFKSSLSIWCISRVEPPTSNSPALCGPGLNAQIILDTRWM